ncbi:MAG: DUF3467 domain-containing protein [Calditrichia bacterium]
MSNSNQGPKQQINVELPPEQAEGIYSNLAIISHSQAEFVVDFTRLLPGVPKAKVYARIILTPQHAKALLHTLDNDIKKFEEQNGEIKLPNQQQGKPFGFQQSNEQ